MKHIHIEGTGKPLKVVAPIDATDITKGKEYTVIGYWADKNSGDESKGWGFYIKDDVGHRISNIENESGHINGHNWIVTEREATENTD